MLRFGISLMTFLKFLRLGRRALPARSPRRFSEMRLLIKCLFSGDDRAAAPARAASAFTEAGH